MVAQARMVVRKLRNTNNREIPVSEDFKRAAKSYQNAFTMEAIGDLTKDMMLEKADELRRQIKK